jgi:hypothetical protein
MKSDEKKRLRLNMERFTIEYPSGLEKFLPVDEKAIRLLDIDDPTIDSNVEKYFKEQAVVKQHVKESYEEVTKLLNEYQENARKFVEYIKGLSL